MERGCGDRDGPVGDDLPLPGRLHLVARNSGEPSLAIRLGGFVRAYGQDSFSGNGNGAGPLHRAPDNPRRSGPAAYGTTLFLTAPCLPGRSSSIYPEPGFPVNTGVGSRSIVPGGNEDNRSRASALTCSTAIWFLILRCLSLFEIFSSVMLPPFRVRSD